MWTERVARHLSNLIGGGPYLALCVLLFTLVPVALLAAGVVLWGRGRAAGAAAGLLVAAWASCCWVVVPYLGVYPNIPGAAFCAVLFGRGTPGQEAAVHLTNLILWPVVGHLFFRLARRPPPGFDVNPRRRLPHGQSER